MIRRLSFLILFLSLAFSAAAQQAQVPDALKARLDKADGLRSLKTVIVARNGAVIAERGYHGHSVTEPANIKSVSKSIVSALVGIAIDRKLLTGVDETVAPLLKADLPPSPDPRLSEITIGNLLSMQAGLGRMSGPNYGRWVSSRNWVRFALAQPFDD